MREYTFDISIHKNNTISVVAESEMEARKEIEDKMESLQDQEKKDGTSLKSTFTINNISKGDFITESITDSEKENVIYDRDTGDENDKVKTKVKSKKKAKK